MNPFGNLDYKKLVLAILILSIFAIFIFSLQFIIPIIGVLITIGIIAAAIYGIWSFLNGQK